MTDNNLGFPADTPVADMTTEQQLAYWRHRARRFEKSTRILYAERVRNHGADDEILQKVETPSPLPPLLKSAVRAELRARLHHFNDTELDELVDALRLERFSDGDDGIDLDAIDRLAGRFTPASHMDTDPPVNLKQLLNVGIPKELTQLVHVNRANEAERYEEKASQ